MNSSVIRRHARIVRVLTALQSGAGLEARRLAAELRVSVRTIYRDVELIREAGVNLVFDDRLGCYRLDDRGMTPVPRFEAAELTYLVMATHLSFLQGLPEFSETLRRSTGKLLGDCHPSVRDSVLRLTRSSWARTSALPDEPDRTGFVGRLLAAIESRRLARLGLGPRSRPATLFAVYRIEVSSDGWRVTGRSTLHGGLTTIDLAEIHSVELTRQNYAIPRGFGKAPSTPGTAALYSIQPTTISET